MSNERNEKPAVWVAEDNAAMRLGIIESLQRQGYSVTGFENGRDLLDYMEKNPREIPLMIVDLVMEPVGGLEVLERAKAFQPRAQVIMITAHGTVENAVKAMQTGAADFLTKPFSAEELRVRVDRIDGQMQKEKLICRLLEEKSALQSEIREQFGDMIGQADVMVNIFQLIERVAAEDSTVLIEGESGTGKELVARALHEKSARSDKPFIRVNCGALHEQLLESELFGHEKGAFTGAVKQRKGRFELADGGTLFLDEIGDISPSLQVKLLRALQEKEFERVGGEATIRTDARIIAATNRNLAQLVKEKKFREDLFYRLRVIPVKLPPLRERAEDIPLLTAHFLEKLALKKGRPPKKIDSVGMKLFKNYSWPGNIREMENLIERLCVISASEVIGTELIAQHITDPAHPPDVFRSGFPIDEAVRDFERGIILDTLKKYRGVKNRAAKALGIKTSTLYSKMEKLGITENKEE